MLVEFLLVGGPAGGLTCIGLLAVVVSIPLERNVMARRAKLRRGVLDLAASESSDKCRPISRRPLRFESLENRALLSVSVSGHVWKDLNSNGIQDAGEPRVPNAVVELKSSTDSTIGNGDDVLARHRHHRRQWRILVQRRAGGTEILRELPHPGRLHVHDKGCVGQYA